MLKTFCAACSVVASLAHASAAAPIRFELPQVTVLAEGVLPTAGSFDVVMRVHPGDLPRRISSFNVDLRVDSSNVVLGPPQAAPTPAIPGPLLNFSPGSQTIRAARDDFPSSWPLQETNQLIRTPFSVAAGTVGSFRLTFGALNQVTDPSATALPIDVTDVGAIVVRYAGDFNHDDRVDAADLSIFARGFGAAGGAQHGQGDANADGAVDGSDFLIWQRQLGRQSPAGLPTSVPEPTALRLWLAGLVGRRRRAVHCQRRRGGP